MAGIGREATAAEIAAWDIDVRPDFKGLPPGLGSVARGEEVWDAKCASCHGTFGESNEVFTPIVGGTTAHDMQVGLASGLLKDGGRTTLMKVSTLSTLWDYINRAMPWNAPRSLTVEEVYASLAYILNLGGIVADDFVLSNENIASVQEKLPNRDGMTRRHGLWTVDGMPDVQATACMNNCRRDVPAIRSQLPEHARDAHGDLSEQQRPLGPTRGAVTVAGQPPPPDFEETRRLARAIGAPIAAASAAAPAAVPPAAEASAAVAAAAEASAAAVPPTASPLATASQAAISTSAAPATSSPVPSSPAATPSGAARVQSAGCSACHAPDRQALGPSWRQIVDRHRDKPDPVGYLAGKIAAGGQGVWGSIPMPPQPALSDADRRAIATWIVAGAR
ncbi:MAG: c-type cytochrome [Burkholderiaceae bacterium]